MFNQARSNNMLQNFAKDTSWLFVWFDTLRLSQQFSSYVKTGRPVSNEH